MKYNFTIILAAAGILFFTILDGRSFRVNEIPNGGVNRCANCHINPAGGGPRNDFGTEVENNHLTAPGSSGHVRWDQSLAELDSDGDGFTNGEELQDPDGNWTSGTIGDPNLVTLPGDPNSHPNPTAVEIDLGLPREYKLIQNYPNPFNPSTTIAFTLPERAEFILKIFDVLGNEVAVLADDVKNAGYYEYEFNPASANGGISSGIYFYVLKAKGLLNNFTSVKKMIYLK